MKWNWAYLFEKLPFSFDELVKDIESAGLMLCNPSSMRITRLTANGLPLDPGKPGSGNQIPSSQSELGSLIYSGHEVPFQWWLDPSRDIFCSIQKISDELLAELYDLGGLTDEEGITLYASLLRRFSRGVAKSSSVGLVFDPKGANEDFDWKEFLLCSKGSPGRLPEVLILPSKLTKRMNIEPVIHDTESFGQFTLIIERSSPVKKVTTALLSNSRPIR